VVDETGRRPFFARRCRFPGIRSWWEGVQSAR
jgi:hypothetical protein